jgi:hypothetical protein
LFENRTTCSEFKISRPQTPGTGNYPFLSLSPKERKSLKPPTDYSKAF